jgi:phosphinothricin acetyltransferase
MLLNGLTIRAMSTADWPEVRTIYEAGIATGDATFETAAPSEEAWDRSHLPNHRLVAHNDDGDIIGWAALSPVSDRCVYGGVAENSIYIHPDAQGCGVGRMLLERLIAGAEAAGIWTLQTGIFPENAASIALHQRCGFRIIGTRERIGQLNGVWRDTLLLERRSETVGC